MDQWAGESGLTPVWIDTVLGSLCPCRWKGYPGSTTTFTFKTSSLQTLKYSVAFPNIASSFHPERFAVSDLDWNKDPATLPSRPVLFWNRICGEVGDSDCLKGWADREGHGSWDHGPKPNGWRARHVTVGSAGASCWSTRGRVHAPCENPPGNLRSCRASDSSCQPIY